MIPTAKKPQKPKLERAARNRGRARCRVGVPYDFGPQNRAKGFFSSSDAASHDCLESAQTSKTTKGSSK